MKINDVIIENEQLDELTAGQVGTAVGKGAGAVAKGVGAVAGGVAGAGKAFMKGFRGGKATVAGDNAESDDPADIQKQIRQKEIELKQLQDKLKTAKTTQAAPTQQPPAAQAAPTQQPPAPQAAPTQQPPAAQATPAATAAQATTAPQAAPTQQPPAAQAATAPAQGQAAPRNAAAGDTYEKAKGDVRKVQSGTKPLPPQMAAGVSADIAKLAKGDKESGVAAADKIMKFAQRDIDVAKLQQQWIANAKTGERFLTQSIYFEITKMLREHNLSWSDLGIRVHLLENTNKLIKISFK